jgi:hypothetical protein
VSVAAADPSFAGVQGRILLKIHCTGTSSTFQSREQAARLSSEEEAEKPDQPKAVQRIANECSSEVAWLESFSFFDVQVALSLTFPRALLMNTFHSETNRLKSKRRCVYFRFAFCCVRNVLTTVLIVLLHIFIFKLLH